MKKDNENKARVELLRELSLAFGASGFESDMHDIIKEKLSGVCSFEYDRLGSIDRKSVV